MWKRLLSVLRCPICNHELVLKSLSETRVKIREEYLDLARSRGVLDDHFHVYIDAGLLICESCDLHFPITQGLPLLLPYTTPAHTRFAQQWPSKYRFPNQTPVPGEQFVFTSFSKEWSEYEYDGVIWESDYKDHESRVCKEIGPAIQDSRWYLEVGCGIGLATSVAQQASSGDALGVDLSVAVMKAARHFRSNPFMHFVQASAFALPLKHDFFDVTYSRGVLHHTYSTRTAFEHLSRHCRKDGTLYVWLYGPGSIYSTPLRLVLYALEAVTRPFISRSPDSLPAQSFLASLAFAYMAFNRIRRMFNAEIQILTFARALHAARDRFTPRFAHRHSAKEIVSWLVNSGFSSVEVIAADIMPPAEREDFERNVGVRGTLSCHKA